MSRLLFIPMLLATGAIGSLSVSPRSAFAADPSGVLAQMYGQGVHAFFNHEHFRAHEILTQAIDAGSQDPRAYYFRGLAAGAVGRLDESEADFQEGAKLEARGNFGPMIGRSLTRIQGPHRMQIESFRAQARLDYHVERASEDQSRYSEAEAREAEVLREPPQPRQPPTIPGYRPLTPSADEPTPFDEPAEPAVPQVQSRDALEVTPPPTDPFSDDPPAPGTPAPTPPAGDDPFGGDTPMDDPFGAPPAGGDPFGAPPAGGDPFGSPPAGGEDPFGGF